MKNPNAVVTMEEIIITVKTLERIRPSKLNVVLFRIPGGSQGSIDLIMLLLSDSSGLRIQFPMIQDRVRTLPSVC